jgi:hypothetical protein
MKQKAVLDRFEGNKAILLINEKPQTFFKSELPKNVKEGDWLLVEIDKGKLIHAEVDEDEKAVAKKRILEKMATLRKGNHLK